MDNEKPFENDLPEDCQPKPLVGGEYELVECKSEHPLCGFAMHFGYRFLCRHPRRKEIFERLSKLKDTVDQI